MSRLLYSTSILNHHNIKVYHQILNWVFSGCNVLRNPRIIKSSALSRVCGDYYKTGIGLTTGFVGSHTVTHNYSVYTL
jgi:hypothetical protein